MRSTPLFFKTYRLQRDEIGHVYIQVHHGIGGLIEGDYIAYPTQKVPIDSAKEEFITYGKSHDEVLQSILEKIKNVNSDDIFQRVKK